MAAVLLLALVFVQNGVFIPMLFYLTTAAACPSFTPTVEEGRAVCPGEELTYTCTIFDDTSLFPTAVWSGFCADSSSIFIIHGDSSEESGMCGPSTVQANGSDGDCYTSTLTVTASPELNGTVIRCSHESVEVGRATLLVAGRCILSCLYVHPHC